MTLQEKQELIKSATTEEELEQRMAEIQAEEPIEEPVQEENQEEVVEEVNNGEISPEEERSLLKDTETLEKRSVEITNFV